jgi:hypothetical protein
LFLDIYRPSANKANLPVYVFIQGGGLNALSDPNKSGENWVNASGQEIIVVTINYRVGVFGFLASKELQKGGALNTGMLDQRMALKWIQKHITKVSFLSPISTHVSHMRYQAQAPDKIKYVEHKSANNLFIVWWGSKESDCGWCLGWSWVCKCSAVGLWWPQ